jgi:hypothetical protein
MLSRMQIAVIVCCCRVSGVARFGLLPDRSCCAAIVTIAIQAAVLLMAVGCQTPRRHVAEVVTLSAGQSVSITRVELEELEHSGRALVVEYATTVEMSDRAKVGLEVIDVWERSHLRGRAEREKVGTVLFIATDAKTRESRSFYLVSDSAGQWRRANGFVAEQRQP